MGKVYLVGMGPGSEDYLIPLARKTIQEADVLIGSQRLLLLAKTEKKKTILLKENYFQLIDYVVKNKEREKIAVLVSGDPGMFSFSHQIIHTLQPNEYEIIPGISSLQLAFARIGESWEDVHIMSLHGRSKKGLVRAVLNNKQVFLFTDKKNTPLSIACFLFRKGIQKREVLIFKNLSLAGEEIIRTDIATLQNNKSYLKGQDVQRKEEFKLCVMLIRK